MLESLTVENYALIDRLEMVLSPELNIITGETGAGKSILLGALGLLLGGKNDGSATRDNTKSCVVEGLFSIGGLGLKELFEQNDWEYEEQITIRRVITASGKSRSFIGDIPVSLSELKLLSSKLIDIHSQHQNQILSDEMFRISSLDLMYKEAQQLLADYTKEYRELANLRRELKHIEEVAASAKRDQEWLTHQVDELVAAKLRVGESEEAEAQLKVLENAEQISQVLSTYVERMDSDDERGVLLALRNSEREMRQIAPNYTAAADYAERIASALAELKDMNSSIAAECEAVEANPERLATVTERIDTLYSLCQKHRAKDVTELIEIRDRYEQQLLTILNSDDQIASLKRQIEKSYATAHQIASKIGAKRRGVTAEFEKNISATLSRLGMEHARFVVVVNELDELTPNGANNVEFLFSSVVGKTPQPLEKIASGGEISRVMLALKTLISQRMELPTIIFDEIDTGVSGRIADAMGEIMAELSQSIQVVDITHLPQVASKGDSHFVVYKENGHTNISKLSPDERVKQIAMMISGNIITPAALQQAKFLLCKS